MGEGSSDGRRRGTHARNRRGGGVLLLGLAAGALSLLTAAPAHAALSATVTINSNINYLGDPGRNFTFTVTNNGTVPVTDVQILNSASSVMPTVGCPTPPTGWTATFTSTQCRFITPAGPNAIAPAQSKNFVVRVTTAAGTQDQMGTFSVLLNQSTYASPYSLQVKIHAWEITDVGFVPAAATVNGPCPTMSKTAPKGVPGRLVVCGINHTTATATPGTATLAGTLIVAPPGTWTSGPVTTGATPRVLGNWANVNLTTAPGTQTLIATVSSAYYATSPATTLGGFTTNQPPVAVNDGPYVINEDSTGFVLANPGILANDSDPDLDPITVKLPVDVLPLHGTLTQNAAGGFTYVPAANYNGSDSYKYKVTDGQADSNQATVSFTINPVQDAPTGLSVSPSSVAENQPVGTTVGTFSTVDVDLPGDSHTYTLVTGTGDTGNANFQISGNTLQTNAVFNFEFQSSYSIRVRSTDSGSNFFEGPLTITITNVNEVPTNLTLDNAHVAENQPVPTLVGNLTATDPDAGDSHTWTFVDTATFPDNASFQIVGNQIKTNAVFDYETKAAYSIKVRGTDAGGLFREETGTITVDPVNEVPTNLAVSPSTVAENQPVGTAVGTITTTDPDAADTHTYTLVDTGTFPDNASFQISGNALQTNAVFDFETKSSYSVRVRTTDAGGLFFDKTITVSITNVNEQPTNLILSNASVNENQPVGTFIGNLSATDPDAGDSHTWTFVDTGTFPDNASFQIVGNQIKTNAVFDFETKSSYSIKVRGTDAGGLFREETGTITITDINDPPVANPDTYGVAGGSITVAAPGVLGNDTDQDVGATRTAVLDTAPSGATTFSLAANGSFSYTTALTTGSDTFTYHAVDNAGASSAVVLVTLNLNIPPTAVNDAATTNEDVGVLIDLSTNDTDTDGPNSALTAVNIIQGPGGTAVLQAGNRSVIYTPNADLNSTTNPGGFTFTYQANDGSSTSTNTATVSITVNAVNDAPVLAAIEPGNAAYTEQTAAVQVTNTITVTDVDDTNIESGVVAITSGFEAGDELLFSNQNGITGSYVSGTGVLTLTGSSSKANYQTALRSITFRNLTSDNPGALRRVTFTINDGSVNSNNQDRNITVTGVNDAPVLAAIEGGAQTYTEQNAAVQVTNTITVADIDDTNMEAAQVRISVGFEAGDELLFSDQNGITGSYVNGTGVMTLTGTSSKANYQTALRSITFRNLTSDNPAASKTVEFKVNDGSVDSNLQTRNITITGVNDAPVLAAIEVPNLPYTEQAAGTQITNTITVTDPDDTNIESADVRITTGFQSGDELIFVNQNGITGSYATGTGILTMTGTSTVANYQTALRSIQFRNLTNDNPTNFGAAPDRRVEFKVNDGSIDSNLVSRILSITAVNDRPVMTVDAGTVGYTENAPAVVISPNLTVADVDNVNLTFAQVDMSAGGFILGQDTLSFTGSLPPGVTFSGVHPSGVAQWIGSATPAQYQALLRTVTYSNTADNFTSTSRTVTFRVGDGSTNSVDKSRGVVITPVNDAPVLANAGSTLPYIEGDVATIISPTITATDVDSANLTGATIDFNFGFNAAEDELLFTNIGPITGSYVPATGVLTLSGTDTVANYEAALRTIKYRNNSDNPSANKTIRFVVTDGALPSAAATRAILITAVNDPPVNTTPSSPQTGIEDQVRTMPMSVADLDIGTNPLKVTLTAANGTMTMTTLTGLTFAGGGGDGTNDASMVFTGTLTNVNTALNTLSYLGNANYNEPFAGDSSVTILSDDQGATGTGGALTDSDFVRIDLAAVNDAPVAVAKNQTLNANMAFNDVANMLVGVTDPDSGDPGYVAGHTLNTVTADTCTGANITDIQASANSGSFDINPPPGSTTACTLKYTVIDNGSPVGPAATSTATAINVTLNGPVIWFVDDATGSDSNKGRLTDPFKTLGSALATADAANHKVFLHTFSGYANAFTLEAGEQLIGQGVTGTSFDSVMGVTPIDPDGAGPQGTLARPSINGTRPEIDNAVTFGGNTGVVRGLNITPASGTQGLIASGKTGLTTGEVSVTSANAAAVDLVNSDGTFSFTAVSANGGSNGILWNNATLAASTSSLTVTGGSGTTQDGSGGTIQNLTGTDGTTAGIGVYLNNARNVSLDQLNLHDFAGFALRGNLVNGFTYTRGIINGVNGNNSAVFEESSAYFTDLSGSALFDNVNISGGWESNLYVFQTLAATTLNRLTIDNSTFGLNSTAFGGNSILVDAVAGTTNLTIEDSIMTGAAGNVVASLAGSTATMDLIFQRNAVSNNHSNIVSGGGGVNFGATGDMTALIANNSFRGAKGAALGAGMSGPGAVGNIKIQNNTVGVLGTPNSGSLESTGIGVGVNDRATLNVLVTGNTVREYNNHGILFTAGDTCPGSPAGCVGNETVFNATVTGNTVANPGTTAGFTDYNGIHLNNGTTVIDKFTSCFDMRTNTLTGSGKGTTFPNNQEFRFRQRQATTVKLPGYAGANNDNAAVIAFERGQNTVTAGNGDASNTVATGGGYIGGACVVPT